MTSWKRAEKVHPFTESSSPIIECSSFASYVMALFHIFVFSFPLYKFLAIFQDSAGELFFPRLSALLAIGFSMLLPWAFCAGMARRIDLARSKRLAPSLSWAGVSIDRLVFSKARLASKGAIVILLPFCFASGFCIATPLALFVMLLLIPLLLFASSLGGLALSLILWPREVPRIGAEFLRIIEALGAFFFVISLRLLDFQSFFVIGGQPSLGGELGGVLSSFPFYQGVDALLCFFLGDGFAWDLLLIPFFLLVLIALYRLGVDGYMRYCDLPRDRALELPSRARGWSAYFLLFAVFGLSLDLGISLRSLQGESAFLLWTSFVYLSSSFVFGVFSRPSPRERVMNESLYPKRSSRRANLRKILRDLLCFLPIPAVLFSLCMVNGWCSFYLFCLLVLELLLLLFIVALVLRLPWGLDQSQRGVRPGGRRTYDCGIDVSHLLACQSVLVFILAVVATGFYASFASSTNTVLKISWWAIAVLTTGGLAFFAAYLPLVLYMSDDRAVDRPFAPYGARVFS